MSLKLGTTPIAGLNTNTNSLFDFKWSDHLQNDMNWLRADTFSWQSGLVYSNAYNHLVTDISGVTAETETIGSYTVTFYRATDGHKICLADQETAVSNIYTESGIAWYYILDTTNTQFKLPRTKWGFKGLRDNVGDNVDQTVLLPNITGTLSPVTGTYNTYVSGSGSLTTTNSGANTYEGGSAALRYSTVTLDASASSSVYSGDGTNTNIDEKATQMYLYFYVGQFSQTAIEQTAGLTTEIINSKVDIPTGKTQADVKVIIDTYVSGTSGYRIWSDGYCEQWGNKSSLSQDTYTAGTVTFLKTFADTNYNIVLVQYDNEQTLGLGASSAGQSVHTKAVGSFGIASYSWTYGVDWKACGYLASDQY